MTPETLSKLESVFAIGGTDKEACFYAGISPQSLYKYQEENPDYVERKEALKEQPMLKARQTIVKALDTPAHAQWYASRKAKNEFAERIEKTGADGKDLHIEDSDIVKERNRKLNELYKGTSGGSVGSVASPVDIKE